MAIGEKNEEKKSEQYRNQPVMTGQSNEHDCLPQSWT